MPASLINQIHALLDEHGWAEFLATLAEVARNDGLADLAAAIEPFPKLIGGDFNGQPS